MGSEATNVATKKEIRKNGMTLLKPSLGPKKIAPKFGFIQKFNCPTE
jgi:hypothetical protein